MWLLAARTPPILQRVRASQVQRGGTALLRGWTQPFCEILDPCLPSGRLLWVFPKPCVAGVYIDWASSAPFLHLSLVPTFPGLPDAHSSKQSLCLSLARITSRHGQLWSTLPPARQLIPKFSQGGPTAPGGHIFPTKAVTGRGTLPSSGLYTCSLLVHYRRPVKVPLQPPLGGFLYWIMF